MEGKIELSKFIDNVISELKSGWHPLEESKFDLEEVSLEVSFSLETEGNAGFKLFAINFGASVAAEQVHKVTLRLKPNGTGSRGLNTKSKYSIGNFTNNRGRDFVGHRMDSISNDKIVSKPFEMMNTSNRRETVATLRKDDRVKGNKIKERSAKTKIRGLYHIYNSKK
jgi:hypothetical protein